MVERDPTPVQIPAMDLKPLAEAAITQTGAEGLGDNEASIRKGPTAPAAKHKDHSDRVVMCYVRTRVVHAACVRTCVEAQCTPNPESGGVFKHKAFEHKACLDIET